MPNESKQPIYCDTHPRMSRLLINCQQEEPKIAIKNLLLLYGILTVSSFIFGILYMIFKAVPLDAFLRGEISWQDIITQLSTVEICDNDPIDVWSICHFVTHGFIVVIAYAITKKANVSVLISILIIPLWEAFERITVIYIYNFSCESWGNTISDVIFGVLGALIVYFILISPKIPN